MQITIQVRNVYGVNKAYPDCDVAQTFANIAGTKTLTPYTLRQVLSLGYDVVVSGGPSGTIYANGAFREDKVAALRLAA